LDAFSKAHRTPRIVGDEVKLVTEFWGSPSFIEWEHAFNHAIRDTNVPEVEIIDRRHVSGSRGTDLLVSVADADAVINNDPVERARVLTAHTRCTTEPRLTVGIATHGAPAAAAATLVLGWLPQVYGSTCYVQATPTRAELYEVICSWLQLVAQRLRPRAVGGPEDDGASGSLVLT